jgi:hypothetical protein
MNGPSLIWVPEPLTARLMAAQFPARNDYARAAQLRAPRGVRVQVIGDSVGTMDPKGLFFEVGTDPHEIKPKKKVLRLADGRFVTGPVKHPGMKARPFLRPLLPSWSTFYKRQAAQVFRGF